MKRSAESKIDGMKLFGMPFWHDSVVYQTNRCDKRGYKEQGQSIRRSTNPIDIAVRFYYGISYL